MGWHLSLPLNTDPIAIGRSFNFCWGTEQSLSNQLLTICPYSFPACRSARWIIACGNTSWTDSFGGCKMLLCNGRSAGCRRMGGELAWHAWDKYMSKEWKRKPYLEGEKQNQWHEVITVSESQNKWDPELMRFPTYLQRMKFSGGTYESFAWMYIDTDSRIHHRDGFNSSAASSGSQ